MQLQFSGNRHARPIVTHPPVPRTGHSNQPQRFDIESQPQAGTSTRASWWTPRKLWGLGIAALVLVAGGITGGIAAACNIRPSQAIASTRTYGVKGFCPDAYLLENGDVQHPLLRYKDGHISRDGKATNKLTLAKGEAREDGKLYTSYFKDKADSPLPIAQVSEGGTVKDWPIPSPIGKIQTFREGTPRRMRDALGLWTAS